MAKTSVTASAEGLISIGQLAAETGVSSRTIRYYEELGILPEPPRTAGGTRKYGPEYRFYVEGAVALKELGFSLEEIKLVGRLTLGRAMTPRQAERAAAAIAEKREILERKVQVLDRLRGVLGDREAGVASSTDLRELADVLNGDE